MKCCTARNALGAVPGFFAHKKCLESMEYCLSLFQETAKSRNSQEYQKSLKSKAAGFFAHKLKHSKCGKFSLGISWLFQEFLDNEESLDTPVFLGFFLDFLHVPKRPETQEFYSRVLHNSGLL